jgi:enamine deaminase RidA (YjgF/YER057c/UK114 family)
VGSTLLVTLSPVSTDAKVSPSLQCALRFPNKRGFGNMTLERFHVGKRLSDMVVHNGTVYLAGQIPETLNADITTQTREVLKQIDQLLAEAGTDKTRLLSATIFITDMRDFPGMNEAWDEWVPAGHTPARATVEARLANPGWKVEIQAIAATE